LQIHASTIVRNDEAVWVLGTVVLTLDLHASKVRCKAYRARIAIPIG
jgi:cell division protein ZapA (FtsZ GTPase activity inhibitor)